MEIIKAYVKESHIRTSNYVKYKLVKGEIIKLHILKHRFANGNSINEYLYKIDGNIIGTYMPEQFNRYFSINEKYFRRDKLKKLAGVEYSVNDTYEKKRNDLYNLSFVNNGNFENIQFHIKEEYRELFGEYFNDFLLSKDWQHPFSNFFLYLKYIKKMPVREVKDVLK